MSAGNGHGPHWHVHADAAGLARALSTAMQRHCLDAIATRGAARIGLAGGSTPLAAYADFAAAQLPWPNIRLALIDERAVPLDDSQSNERAIGAAFAPVRDRLGAWQGLYLPAADLAASARQADAAIRTFGPLDLTVIGMGADGHIASLFVESADYPAAMAPDAVAAVLPIRFGAGDGRTDRLSFTLARLLDTRAVLFCVTGADKREVLERSIDGSAPQYAVARFLAAYHGPVDIHWSPA